MMREDYRQHINEAAASHHNLQSAEIQWLRQAINDKVKNDLFSYLSSIIDDQNSEWALKCKCKFQEDTEPQKPNCLKGKHTAELTFPKKWYVGKEKIP